MKNQKKRSSVVSLVCHGLPFLSAISEKYVKEYFGTNSFGSNGVLQLLKINPSLLKFDE